MSDKKDNTSKDQTPPAATPAPEPAPSLEGFVTELPKGVTVIEDTAPKKLAGDGGSELPLGAAFTDEFHGKGGSFSINPKTGKREPVYEAVVDPVTGKSGYVPAK
jgi:hypothetical protein